MDQYIPLEERQQGVALAGQLEQRAGKARNDALAGFEINTKPPVKVAKPVAVPPSAPAPNSGAPGFPGDIPPMPGERPVTYPVPVKVATAPAPAPVATSGDWRIQLGAFGNEANAKSLWNSLEAKIGDLANLTPYLKAAGNVTRLQAGPFSSRASAEAMCGKVKAKGQACIVTSN
jgi:cell division septation protein DedD